jgi:hypothetical protein
MDCDFNPQDQPIQRIKQSNVVETHYTGMVPVVKGVPHEFVTTTVTADDEWSNVSSFALRRDLRGVVQLGSERTKYVHFDVHTDVQRRLRRQIHEDDDRERHAE